MPEVFDIIFAGGGMTACVVAGRLATADPSLKILVVESGQHSHDLPRHVQPCRYLENLMPSSTTLSFHVAKPSPYLNKRAAVASCAKAVGGGSAINFMLYVRGAKSDFDEWSALGNEGWSFAELLPLFKKLETFTPISASPTHGYSGPIRISPCSTDLGIGRQFLDVAKSYDPDRLQVNDNNDFKTANAYSICKHSAKQENTLPTNPAVIKENPNLKIMVETQVKRVVTENGRAVGIEYIRDDEVIIMKASKLIIVSAGAFGSPSILERSGIGAPSVLERCNIPIVVNLPGVGENYQDHLGTCSAFYASDETETMDDVWNDPQATSAQLPEWEKNGMGKIAHTGTEAILKVCLTAAQLASSGEALQLRWEMFFQNSPGRPLGMIMPFAGFPLDSTHANLVGRKLFSLFYYILYPDCTSSVHIISALDLNSPLEFDPGYCSKAGDVAQLILLYKMSRERTRRMPAYRGNVIASHPKFPTSSPAACKELDDPVPMDAPDIVYSAADDVAIENFTRDTVDSTWHSLGTCAMKPRDRGGVVDARLNVYGVEGLKVADLSICPTNVGNNTYSTALLIGEKAATIIEEDLGITLKRR